MGELSLLLIIPNGLGSNGQSPLRGVFRAGEDDIFAAFTRWASTATPPLTLTWRSSSDVDEEGWQWPDLGQTGDDDLDSTDDD